jgi:hypothetical protein
MLLSTTHDREMPQKRNNQEWICGLSTETLAHGKKRETDAVSGFKLLQTNGLQYAHCTSDCASDSGENVNLLVPSDDNEEVTNQY